MGALSPTARVILGMIKLGRRTGYDIKALVDSSTAFFWSASYGQIYPELKRLERQGLIRAAGPAGTRGRTEYELTADGEEMLRAWLTSTEEPIFELRDEAALKLFFASAMSPEEALAQARLARRRHERALERLRDIQAVVQEEDGDDTAEYQVLLAGIAFEEFMVGLYARADALVPTGERRTE